MKIFRLVVYKLSSEPLSLSTGFTRKRSQVHEEFFASFFKAEEREKLIRKSLGVLPEVLKDIEIEISEKTLID